MFPAVIKNMVLNGMKNVYKSKKSYVLETPSKNKGVNKVLLFFIMLAFLKISILVNNNYKDYKYNNQLKNQMNYF